MLSLRPQMKLIADFKLPIKKVSAFILLLLFSILIENTCSHLVENIHKTQSIQKTSDQTHRLFNGTNDTNEKDKSTDFYETLQNSQLESGAEELIERATKVSIAYMRNEVSLSRMLATCMTSGCISCVTFEREFCMFCEEGKRLSAGLDFCGNESTVNMSSIQRSNCSVQNCENCIVSQVNSEPFEMCFICKVGFRLMALNYSCVANDQFIDSEGIISYNNYYFVCPPGCATCSGYIYTSCYICKEGYSLRQEINSNVSFCFKCRNNCRTCVGNSMNPTQCLTCFQGFVLLNGNCVKCTDSNCSSCQSANLASCTSCKQSLMLANASCQNCLPNCKACSNDSTCDTCSQGYVLVRAQNGSQSCVKCIYGCYDCQAVSACRFCYPGHYQNAQNQCVRCGENCRVCTSSQNCSSCHSGYDLFNGNCMKQISNCMLAGELNEKSFMN